MKFYKITNKEERHWGMVYHDGLNVDIMPFNPSGNCEPGGIYFTREDVLSFLDYAGNDLSGWIREVTIPDGEPVYENPIEPRKWKAHRVILGKRKKITPKVVEELIQEGANIHSMNDYALRFSAMNGHLSIAEVLLDNGADIHVYNDYPLQLASLNGYVELVKLLLKRGADAGANNSCALRWAASEGHLEIVKLLVKHGADASAYDNCALKLAEKNGHIDVVKFLKNVVK